jgi:hypothetical protein
MHAASSHAKIDYYGENMLGRYFLALDFSSKVQSSLCSWKNPQQLLSG